MIAVKRHERTLVKGHVRVCVCVWYSVLTFENKLLVSLAETY